MKAAAEYRSKLQSPRDAVATIASGATLAMGMGVSEPPALLAALAERIRTDQVQDLRLYYFESKAHAQATVLRYELLDRIRPHCMFLSAVERELMKRAAAEGRQVVDFVPNHFGQAPRLLSEQVQVDAFVLTVSPMDANGYFTFGTNNDYASVVARSAKRLIVEVNPRMPRVFGESLLHVAEVDAVVEHDAPLLEIDAPEPSETDLRIGARIAELVPQGATLQMGIGALPNAVCAALMDHRDLGLHTELLTPGMIALIEHGAVTNRMKALHPRKTVFTFALGDRHLYDFIHDNPGVESYPVQHTNDPAVIALHDRFVSINSTLEMDLTGACNSEALPQNKGAIPYSGSGGQLDFVRGAYASKGGKSIIAFHSTAKRGERSRIVGRLSGPTTTPRTDVHIAMTEHGHVDLKGKSLRERALGLIGIADPSFRDALMAEARILGLV